LISEMSLAVYNTVIQNYFLLAYDIRYYMMYGPYPTMTQVMMDKLSSSLIFKLVAIIDNTTQPDALKQSEEIKRQFRLVTKATRIDVKVMRLYMANLRQKGQMYHHAQVNDEVWKMMATSVEFQHYMAVVKNITYMAATEHMTFTTVEKAFGGFKDAAVEELLVIGPKENPFKPAKILIYVGASTQNDGSLLQLDRTNIKRSKIYAYDKRYDDKHYTYKAQLKNNGFQYTIKKTGQVYEVMARYPQAPQIFAHMDCTPNAPFDFDINVEMYKNQGQLTIKTIAVRQYGEQRYNAPESEDVLQLAKLEYDVRSIIRFDDTPPDGYIVRGYQFSGKPAPVPFYVKKKHTVDVFVNADGMVGRYQYDVDAKVFREDVQASILMRQHVLGKDAGYIASLTVNANHLIDKAHEEHQYRKCTNYEINQYCTDMHDDQLPKVQPCNNVCLRYQWRPGMESLLTKEAIYGKRDFILDKHLPEQLGKIPYTSKIMIN